MAEERSLLPPLPASSDDLDDPEQAAQGTFAESRPVKGRSLYDFFGKKGQSSAGGQVEQVSDVARKSSKDRGVTSDLQYQPTTTLEDKSRDTFALDGDTSANSITIIESTGSKRKTAPTSVATGRKRTQGKKVTDEDAELKAMEAAAKKKQKAAAQMPAKKGKSVSLVGDNRDEGESAVASPSTLQPTEPKKRGRPRKQPPPAPFHEIIDISSPVKPKRQAVPITTKRGPGSKAKNQARIQEEVDFTVTEEENEVSVVGHSQTGSQSSLIAPRKGRNRVQGTFSAESMGNGGDAIHIDVDEVGSSTTTNKRKTNSATAGKPVHSFFTKPKPVAMDIDQLPETASTSTVPNPFLNSGVQGVSDVQDAQPPNASTTAKPTYDFFSAKSKRAPAQTVMPSTPIETVNPFFTPAPKATVGRPGWAQTTTTVKEARWPCAEEIEEPSEYVNERPRLTLPKRARQRVGAVSEDESFWARLLPKAVMDLDADDAVEAKESEIAAIPDEFKKHPAITSLPTKAANGTKTQLLIDKYRPLNHAEVLGNEVPAKYLVEWLAELAIGIHGEVSEEKRKVQRKVIKTRRKQVREDDWIVEDDEPIRDHGEEDDAPVDDIHTAQQTGYPDLSKRLTNSILLQGPYGSGKTASVYAAAAELGWEVFEVYPGIGKRSGAHLSQLVGDVGKNHMVGKGRPTMPPSPAPEKRQNPLLQAFGKISDKRKPAQSTDHAVDLTNSPARKTQVEMDFGFVAQPADIRDAKTGGPDVRQSLILLEEVDILYEEDKGFWPAVVSLIHESKRPVIMTCNDLSLIPFEDLALQTTVLFSPPEPNAAKALLSGIAVAEGGEASAHYLDSLVQGCQLQQMDPVVFSKPLLPPVERWPLGVDLRAAICQLELELSHAGKPGLKTLRKTRATQAGHQRRIRIKKGEDGTDKGLQDLLAVSQMANIISSVDADIARRPGSVTELNDPDRYKPSEDDETGFHELLKPLPLLETQALPMLSREDEMADITTDLAIRCTDQRDWLDESLIGDLALARQRYQEAALPFLDPLITLDSHLLPSPVLFLDYIPAISWMTNIDDVLQTADLADAAAGRPRINRRTGREMRITSFFSGNQAYVRQMSGQLDESELQAVRDCRLDLGQFDGFRE